MTSTNGSARGDDIKWNRRAWAPSKKVLKRPVTFIRLFLVDDHAVLRNGLRLLLSSQPSLRVVGEAGGGEDLLAQLAQTPADVVRTSSSFDSTRGKQA